MGRVGRPATAAKKLVVTHPNIKGGIPFDAVAKNATELAKDYEFSLDNMVVTVDGESWSNNKTFVSDGAIVVFQKSKQTSGLRY